MSTTNLELMNHEFAPENCYCHFRCHCTVSPLPSPSSSPLSFPSTIAVITPDALTVALPVASPLWFWTPEADEACIAILSSLCFPLSFVYFPSPCFYSTRHSCSPGTRALLISEMQCASTCPSLLYLPTLFFPPKNSSQARWHTGTSDTEIGEDLGLDDDVVNEIYNANLDSNNDGPALCNLGVDDDEQMSLQISTPTANRRPATTAMESSSMTTMNPTRRTTLASLRPTIRWPKKVNKNRRDKHGFSQGASLGWMVAIVFTNNKKIQANYANNKQQKHVYLQPS